MITERNLIPCLQETMLARNETKSKPQADIAHFKKKLVQQAINWTLVVGKVLLKKMG